MKKTLTLFFLTLPFYMFGQLQQQAPWNLNSPKAKRSHKKTLKEISIAAEAYFNTIDRDKKGSGFKPFKRWEHHWSHYLKEDGTIAPAQDLWDAWNQKNEMNASQGKRDNSNWLPLGPFTNSNTYNANDAKQTGQGRVNAIAVDPSNSNTYYVGTPAGGIWKSTDAGINWTPLTDYLPQIGVSGIAIHPTNSNIIYIATGDDDAGDSYAVGVWKSIDGGTTWNKTGDIPGDPTSMNEIYIDPNAPETVLVATNSGVQKTTDGGATWERKLDENIIDLKMKPGDASTWYAVTSSSFYKSTDNGETFTRKTVSGLFSSSRLTMDVTPANPEYVYIVSASNNNNAFNGIYKSTNSGESFNRTAERSDIFGSSQAWYDLALTVSSDNPEIVYVGVLDLWKSTDGGNDFTKINSWNNPNTSTYTHADIHFLRFMDGKFFAGTDGGIFVSTDEAVNFIDLTKNLAISQFYRISVSSLKLHTIAGGLQDNGGFGFSDNEWRNYHGGDGMEGVVDPINPDIFYGFTQFGGSLNKTNDGGQTRSLNLGSPSGERGNWVTPLTINKDGELYAGYSELYKLDNNRWTRISTSPFGDTFGGNLDKVEIAPNNTNNIITSNGNVLYRSTNKGVNFSEVSFNYGPIEAMPIQAIAISSLDSDIVWIVTKNKVYKSTNFFTENTPTFTEISYNLPPLEVKMSIKHHERSGNNTVYLGTSLGVYYISENSTEWTVFDNGLPNLQITDLDINEEDAKLYAATYGRGIFVSDIPKVLPENDVRLLSLNNLNNSLNCNDTVTPEVTVSNQGTQDIASITFNYNFDGGAMQNYTWSGKLSSNQSTTIPLPSSTISIGDHTINIEATIDNDAYASNNLAKSSFIINQFNNTPTTINTFENPEDELLITTDNATMWELGVPNKSILKANSGKAYVTKLSGNHPDQTVGHLYTKCYDLTTITDPVLRFKMAFDIENDWDHMYVEYSTNQGQTWDILGTSEDDNWYNSSATVNGLPGKQWTGEGATINPVDNLPNSDVKDYSYDLAPFSQEQSIVFRFKFVADQAENREGVLIDDLVITGTLAVSQFDALSESIFIYPNPSENIFNIGNKTSDKLNIKVFDMTGKQVFTKDNIKMDTYRLNLDNYAKGIYFLYLNMNGKSNTKKLILK
ncbi:T9SS type A sorting domain-containing protein [Tenacibaculum maritimum]|uniref:T9SS type A sorting domain-containing protein n=1 Tax=Tenacibaculum maritimum TaxID=107401 RepID=UPI0012E5CB0B|nr:T9SS type A sorting domain-containing protein [Tenacibaculum maritimum]CAA0248075.1 Glycoside hydrolase, family GHnc precursor containing a C-terminal secretion signal [Tenacibaculum maritimum]CAA0249530.1 Glycoside hydrolase, family GHnc precursor containing a C-terminal secretion signal [Tenacibaculum maritimum]